MTSSKCLLSSLLGFIAYFVASTHAREAIVGGEIAQIDQFPYQVSLQIDEAHICGGGIIGDKDILTSAQCIVENLDHIYNRLTILARTNNVHHPGSGALRAPVHKAYVPVYYNRRTNIPANDIAVLKLKEPLPTTFHGSLQKASLIKLRDDDRGYRTATIAGFGWTWTEKRGDTVVGNNTDGRLRYAHANIVPCNNPLLDENHICAKLRRLPNSIPAGTCLGDTGDLLIGGEKSVIGILSVGPSNCDNDATYAVYSRAAHHFRFIRNAKENKRTKNMREIILSD